MGVGVGALSGAVTRIPSDAEAVPLGVCEADVRELSVPSPPILTPVPSPLAHAGLRGSAAEADGADSAGAELAAREGDPLAEEAMPMDGDTLAVSLAEAPLEALSGEGAAVLCAGLSGDGLTVARAGLSGEELAVLPVGVVIVAVPTLAQTHEVLNNGHKELNKCHRV